MLVSDPATDGAFPGGENRRELATDKTSKLITLDASSSPTSEKGGAGGDFSSSARDSYSYPR